MRPPFPIIALFLTLMACATPPAASAPACGGPHRPANPYGSVLTDPADLNPTPATAPEAAPPCGGAAR